GHVRLFSVESSVVTVTRVPARPSLRPENDTVREVTIDACRGSDSAGADSAGEPGKSLGSSRDSGPHAERAKAAGTAHFSIEKDFILDPHWGDQGFAGAETRTAS